MSGAFGKQSIDAHSELASLHRRLPARAGSVSAGACSRGLASLEVMCLLCAVVASESRVLNIRLSILDSFNNNGYLLTLNFQFVFSI